MEGFGKRLKELRKEKGISVIELSKKINYSKSVIFYWQSDEREPSISALKALCDFFDVSADYFLGR